MCKQRIFLEEKRFNLWGRSPLLSRKCFPVTIAFATVWQCENRCGVLYGYWTRSFHIFMRRSLFSLREILEFFQQRVTIIIRTIFFLRNCNVRLIIFSRNEPSIVCTIVTLSISIYSNGNQQLLILPSNEERINFLVYINLNSIPRFKN